MKHEDMLDVELPEYVIGRLDAKRSTTVESRAQQDGEFAQQLQFDRKVHRAIARTRSEGAAITNRFAELKSRIASERSESSAVHRPASPRNRLFASRWQPLAAAAAVLFAAVIVAYQADWPWRGAEYHTLSSTTADGSVTVDNRYVRVSYKLDTNRRQQQGIEARFALVPIVDRGQRGSYIYKVQRNEDIDDLLRQLKAEPAVASVAETDMPETEAK